MKVPLTKSELEGRYVAIVLILFFLIMLFGCGAQVDSDGQPVHEEKTTEGPRIGKQDSLSVTTLDLPDGRRVVCVYTWTPSGGVAIDCDWDNAE